MFKHQVTIGDDLLKTLALTKVMAARMVAVKVVAEFDRLLLEAPQYSGNYVANMKLELGSEKGSESRPYIKYPKRPKRAGTMAPINRARKENDLDNFEENFVTYALAKDFVGVSMIAWNPLREAEYIEGMPEWRLREPNKIGFNAFEKFNSRISDVYFDIYVNVA